MEVKIRNLNVAAVKKIDELAKRKKMSRQQYLKIIVEKSALFDVYQDERNRFEDTLQKTMEVLARMMKMVHDQQEEIKKLKVLFILTMDIDEEEEAEFLEKFNIKNE